MKKPILLIGLSLVTAAALVGCGGGGSDSSDSTSSGSGNTATPPTSTQAASICSGTQRASTLYDVFLNTANGITQSLASRYVGLYGQTTDNNQCISVAASTAQADTTPGTFQAVTTDNWNNAIAYFDPVGTSITGGIKFNQNLFVTCKSGSDTYQHVAISNPANSSTFVSTNQVATIAKDSNFQSYECQTSGSPAFTGSSVTVSSTTGAITVTDPTNGNTTIAAADVPSLFTTTGYNLNGKIIRWYLYQLPAGSGTKQAIVHTSQRTDGTYNIDLFLQQ